MLPETSFWLAADGRMAVPASAGHLPAASASRPTAPATPARRPRPAARLRNPHTGLATASTVTSCRGYRPRTTLLIPGKTPPPTNRRTPHDAPPAPTGAPHPPDGTAWPGSAG